MPTAKDKAKFGIILKSRAAIAQPIILNSRPVREALENNACEAYIAGDAAPLVNIILADKITLQSTRDFVAMALEGKIKKKRGRPKGSESARLEKEYLIRKDFREWQNLMETLIAGERLGAALKAARVAPTDISSLTHHEIVKRLLLPIPKGWKNTGGSAKHRALRIVGKKYRLSPERISEIVYPRKMKK